MKTSIKIISVLILFFLGFTLKAQLINVCGTDTIILKLNNYQEGVVQWQESIDSVNWVDIDGANDSVYKFFPTEEKFYRAVNTFSNCSPEYSTVSFVQLPPVANAGPDRKVPSTSIVLKANNTKGALGTWTILQGSGGSFSNLNDPYSTFTASDSLYKLIWSVTNTCGSSSDTITVEFVQNEYYDELVVVDTTDIILSDSVQLANGFYKIKFNNPVPNITDSTVLVGLPNNGFLQKIDSFTSSNDTFMIYTHKANLMDVIRKGAYNIGDVMEMDSSMTKASNGFMRLNRMPTRADLMNDSKFKSGNYFYIVDDKVDYLRPGVKINQNKAKGNLIDLSLNTNIFNNGTVSMDLEGYYKFNPNFVADLDYSTCWCLIPVELDKFKMGMYNATTKRGYKLTISASASCSLADKEFTLFSKSKRTIMVIGGVPIYIKTTFSVEGEFGAYTNGSLTLSHEFDKTTSLTAGIEYKNGKWSYPHSKSSTTTVDNNLSANAALFQDFKVGPKLEFSIYGTVSPYVQAMLTEDLTIFAGLYNTDPYWTAQVNIGGEITAGVAAEVLGYNLFDLNHTWSSSFYTLVLPKKIKMISGNNQSFLLGDPLNNNPKIRVVSSEGFGVPGVAVFFTPLDGGSVTDNKVFTNTHGEASTEWTPGNTFSRLEANAYGNFFGGRYKINNSPVTFIANGNYNCSTSSLAANIIENNGVISPKGINGSPPYQYSTDAISYSSVAPSITTNYGQSYTFYVKDDNNCIASKAYSSPPDPCLNSTLVVNAFAVGNAIKIKASNGSEPYQFSVDNVNYSSDTIYANMNIGQYYAFVIDDLGCKDSTTVDIITNQPAINANFSADSLIFEVGDTVQFLNQSNNAYSFLWSFGDGNSSTLENPKHAYNSAGYYDIILNVSNAYGSDSHTMNNYIDVGYAPTPDFSCSSSAVVNHPVTFTDISTNNPSSWYWIIGNDTLIQQNPVYHFTNSGYHSVKLITINKYGKSSITKANIIEILPAPLADFYCNDSTGGIGSGGNEITFYDNSSGSVNSWLWDFGDGNNSIMQNPTYLYSSTGIYDIKLVISDGYNTDSITKINLIEIGDKPIVGFIASADTIAVGDTVFFSDTSTNNPNQWWWIFDGGWGNSTFTANTFFVFDTVGIYNVKLLASNDYGSNIDSMYIYVVNPPAAGFIASNDTIVVSDTVYFTDTSTNNPTSWQWNFGDGNTSTLQNPTHSYSLTGNYTVKLLAANNYGLDSIVQSNLINVGEIPTTTFNYYDSTKAIGDTIHFNNNTLEIANQANTYKWYFGDGDSSNIENPKHVYNANGFYDVTLIASNIYGSDTIHRPNYIEIGDKPIVGFIASADTIAVGDTVFFSDTSTNNPNQWWWIFDGGWGNSTFTANTFFVFDTVGIYNVKLLALNDYGSNIDSMYIYVGNPPAAGFIASNDTIVVSDTVYFTDTSTNNPTSWQWNFGDGNYSSSQNPSHTYITSGTYTVSLTASNAYGSDIESKTAYITVGDSPIAAFTASTITPTVDSIISFTDQSSGTPTSWLWNFGDGNSSTSQNPSHTYTTAGSYTVSLTVTNLYGNDILTKTSYIYVQQQLPTISAAFNVDKNIAHIGDSVRFTDLSIGSPNSWLWYFGDGDSSSLQNPVHIYNTTGTFEIKLLISDSLSTDTAVKTIKVLSLEDGLVAYYPFSGNPADSSGNGHHGTEYGGVSLTNDKMGNPNSAYNFDGVNDYIKVNDHDSLDLTNNMTISAWIKVDSFSFLNGIVSKYHTNASNGFTFRLGYSSPYRGLNCNGRRTSETLLQTNTWFHVVSVVDNNVVNIYVNGQVVSTSYSVIPAQSNSNFMAIGMDYYSSARYFDGIIDEVRIYNRPLTDYEIQSLYSSDYTQASPVSGFTVSQDTLFVGDTLQFTDTSANNPTSWNWDFGDGNSSSLQNPQHIYSALGDYTITLIASNGSASDTSTTQVKVYSLNQALLAYYPFSGNANDISGNGHNGILNGAVLTTDSIGNPNNAYEFDGVNDYINLNNPTSLKPTGSITIMAWAKADNWSPNVYNPIYSNTEAGGFSLALYETELRFYCRANGAYLLPKIDNSILSPGWHYIVGVYDGRYAKLYIDGVCVDTVDAGGNYPIQYNNTTVSLIGAEPLSNGNLSGHYFDGKIDEVRLYGRSLSSFEVEALFNSINSQMPSVSGFTMSQDTLLIGDTLQLTDTSANNPTSWNWGFGDGNSSSLQNPQHIYSAPGDYTITLVASNASGSDTSYTQVKVYSLNQALLAYYPFSGNANDSSGNSEHLTVNGASLCTDRFGNPNSAYSFDGVDDYLKNASPGFAMGEDSSFTVSLWVNSTGTGRYFWHGLLQSQGGYGKFIYFMAAVSSQNSQLGVAKQGLAWTWTYYPNSYNTWEHWVFVYDNGQIKLYKNGSEVASNTYTKAGASTSTMPFYLGCESGVSGYLNGKIDEVRIYRRALSTFEIQKLY